MQVTDFEIPSVAGASFAGGLYAGRYFLGDTAFALIVAEADEGELTEVKWGARKKIAGADDPEDGLLNTKAMLAAGNELAQWARNLRIDSFDDWYLPSRLEFFLAWLKLRDTAHFARTWYWTSTQGAAYDEYAWVQHFDSGYQSNYLKEYHCRARAVRRIPIESFAHSAIPEAA